MEWSNQKSTLAENPINQILKINLTQRLIKLQNSLKVILIILSQNTVRQAKVGQLTNLRPGSPQRIRADQTLKKESNLLKGTMTRRASTRR